MASFQSLARKVIALGVIAAGLALTVAPAEAQWRRGPRAGVVAAAAIGGLAAGALIAGASRPAYAAPGHGYYQQGYYAPAATHYSYAPAQTYYAPAYHQRSYYAPAYHQPSYYAPAYATRTYYHQPRPRRVYHRYAAYEPVCTIRRQKVWLSPNTYTFRRATVCR